MAVLSGATASGRVMFNANPPTSLAVAYTAPTNNANVTSPSATAYIKEIILCNQTGTTATVTIQVSNVNIVDALTINPNDTKVISGLNTMIPASGTIQTSQGTANAISCYISGVEIQ